MRALLVGAHRYDPSWAARALGGGLIRFRVVGIESKRGEPKTRTLLDQALNFKAPGSKLWQNGRRLYANDTKS